jgi:glycosyltransferase involved in cell wall biosynthesis
MNGPARINRVAIVSEHASPIAPLGSSDAGGQNVYVAAVAGELAARGIDVVVYTRRDDPGAPERVRLDSGVTVHYVDAGPPVRVSRDALLPFMAEFGGQLARAWSGWRPDVVHAHYWMSGLASLGAAAQSGVPVVQTFHALGATKHRHQGNADTSPPERRRCEAALASSVAAVVATSDDELEELQAEGAHPRRTTVVPCGVDTSRFAPVTGRAERSGRVVSVGRLVERKGVDDLIRSLPELPEVRLVIAGGSVGCGDVDARRLHALADRLDVAGRVDLIGPLDHEDVPQLLRSADVVACVPWYEPFGLAALEAMACGIPVVASAVGGLRRLVVDNETGLHVPPRDPDRIASSIRRLLDDRDLRVRLGTNGARRAASLYTWSRVTDLLLQLYVRVVEESAAWRPSRNGCRRGPTAGSNGSSTSSTAPWQPGDTRCCSSRAAARRVTAGSCR